MTILTVPAVEKPEEMWPTLGPQICDWIEGYLVFGPGDLRGQPYRLDDEKRSLLYRIYEVHPKGHRLEGRRRFRRVAISLRKGSAKTEFAAAIAAAELHPDAPVRCERTRDGKAKFNARGDPVGVGVIDPFVAMAAYTEEQTEELAYAALRVMLGESPLAGDFDIGLDRIMRIRGDGKALALATAPDSNDGQRTTFEHFDETHRWDLPRHKKTHQTMLANLPKRLEADAWALETTTAGSPGEQSVAEDTMDYARQVYGGKIADSKLFFFHRQAGDGHDLTTPDGIRAAVMEASGPVAVWSNIDAIVDQWADPTADRTYLERVWLNRWVRAADRAFSVQLWKTMAKPHLVPRGEMIVLGFDGARYHDATGIIATHVATGYQWVIGIWEQPDGIKNWEVPVAEVDAAVADAFERWQVWRMYGDPPYWETYLSKWAGEYGDKVVVEWWTNRPKQMAYALKAFDNAIKTGELSHDGSAAYTRHVGNACRHNLTLKDETGQSLWTIYKERPDSPHKIDLAVAGALSWEARCDALAAGVNNEAPVGIRYL